MSRPVRIVVLEHRPERDEIVARVEVELEGRQLVAAERVNLGYPRTERGKVDREALARIASELVESFLRRVARLEPERAVPIERRERRSR